MTRPMKITSLWTAVWTAALFLLGYQAANGAPGDIRTVVGGSVLKGPGSKGHEAAFGGPWGITLDAEGNIYVADWRDHRIRRIDGATGVVSTVAGTGEEGLAGEGEGILASVSRIDVSQDVAVDSRGRVLFSGSRTIRRIRLDGKLETIARGVSGREGIPAFSAPGGRTVTTDPQGNIFLGDQHRVRVIEVGTNLIRTVIGEGPRGFSGDGGPATAALLNAAQGVFVDAIGDVLVADQNNHRIRVLDTSAGTIRTLAGNGRAGFSGDGGPATLASLNQPRYVYGDESGNIYIADFRNHRVRRVDAQGRIWTFAGTGEPGFSGESGPATQVQLFSPMGVWGDGDGNIYITERENQRVRKVTPDGHLSTLAGGYLGDSGPASEAALNFPSGVFVDSDGRTIVADSRNLRVRVVDPATGVITTLAGGGRSSIFDGVHATQASLGEVRRAIADGEGRVFFAEGDRIWAVTAAGFLLRVAGQLASRPADEGTALGIELSEPDGLVIDSEGNLFISDTGNHRVIRVDGNTGQVAVVAGTGEPGFAGDGGPAQTAALTNPRGLFITPEGDLYIADSGNGRIRRVDGRSATISSVAGAGPSGRVTDGGPATEAAVGLPADIFVDAAGDLFIAQAAELTLPIRKVSAATGVISTIAGTGAKFFFGDGGRATESSVWAPRGVYVDAEGGLLIADTANSRIRRVEGAAAPTLVDVGVFSGPTLPPSLPVVVVNEESINLGTVDLERGANSVLRVQNTGVSTLVLTEIETDVVDLTVPESLEIPPGESRDLILKFDPQLEGDILGSLDFVTNDPKHSSVSITISASVAFVAVDRRTDFDGDGIVGFNDFIAFAGAFGTSDATFDLDESGAVDFNDFLVFASSFGKVL